MINEIKREEEKVTVNLPEKLKLISLASLPAACLPSQEATNRLASAKAKALKAQVQHSRSPGFLPLRVHLCSRH